MNATKMVPVDQLQVGMYVAQLDRPWLETPFLFQGFYIRDSGEIEEIKSHCDHVYVSRESLPFDPSTIAAPASTSTGRKNGKKLSKRRFSFRSLFRPKSSDEPAESCEQTGVYYEETTTFKDEIQTADGVHEQAVATVQGVMDTLKSSGNLGIGELQTAVTPMVDSVLRNPAALACLIRMQKKDDYLYHHSLACSVWATILGRQLGLVRTDIDVVALGAMLLDVGKTQVPNQILTKPERLSDEEEKLMRRHVQFGLDILEKAGNVDSRVIDMVAHHHERYNGTGYPAAIKGSEIPVFGRIAGIVDAYDAMITPRPYAKLLSSYDAIRKLRVLADVEFQAEIVDQFTRAIGAFPTGTLVELNTGEVAIVTRQNEIRRLRPEVMIVMDTNGIMLDDFRLVDLDQEKVSQHGRHSLWIERGLPPGAHGIDPTEFYLG